MKANKIIGYTLFIIGLLLIAYALLKSYNIFTGKELPPTVFQNISESERNTKTSNLNQLIQNQIEGLIQEKIDQILPPIIINKILNLIAFSIFSLILIFAGSILCNLGIRMIRS